jgi:hypothetical protein
MSTCRRQPRDRGGRPHPASRSSHPWEGMGPPNRPTAHPRRCRVPRGRWKKLHPWGCPVSVRFALRPTQSMKVARSVEAAEGRTRNRTGREGGRSVNLVRYVRYRAQSLSHLFLRSSVRNLSRTRKNGGHSAHGAHGARPTIPASRTGPATPRGRRRTGSAAAPLRAARPSGMLA